MTADISITVEYFDHLQDLLWLGKGELVPHFNTSTVLSMNLALALALCESLSILVTDGVCAQDA